MKKNLLIRVMTALGGLTLWLMGLTILAETFFRIPVSAWITVQLGGGNALPVLLALVAAALLCVFGTCCFLLLCPRKAIGHGGFVMQKGENGTIGVSVRSIEGLVQTCVKQHPSVAEAEISIVERRDGIVILMNIQEEAGVNIPLAVGAMQKQIKQYVTACTGVDVQEVRVLVESTELRTVPSPYAVKEIAPEAAPEMVQAPVEQPESPEKEGAEAILAAEPVGVAMPPMPALEEYEDDRPLHQRLFGAEEEPAIVPAPPQMTAEPQAEESAPEASAEETAEEEDGMDPNAVLEVVEAMSAEEDEPPADGAAEDASAGTEEPFTQDD